MNIFLFELWNDSTKTIRLLALSFYFFVHCNNPWNICNECDDVIKYTGIKPNV